MDERRQKAAERLLRAQRAYREAQRALWGVYSDDNPARAAYKVAREELQAAEQEVRELNSTILLEACEQTGSPP